MHHINDIDIKYFTLNTSKVKKNILNIPLLLSYLSYKFGMFTQNRTLTLCLSKLGYMSSGHIIKFAH